MSTIKLEFPVWVRHENGIYMLRPLMKLGPDAVEDRYEKAFKSLAKQVRKQFSHFSLNPESLAELLWLRFNPQLRFEAIELAFRYGKRYFQGAISVAWFPLREYTVVLLPAFENHFFISAHADPRRSELIGELTTQIQQFVRKRNKISEEELILDDYRTQAGEYCSTLDLHLHLPDQPVEFVHDEEAMMRHFFRQQGNFSGRIEIERVGEAMNERYPEGLERAYHRESLVAQLRQSLYNRENVPVVLLGARQVGKTALLHETVYQYIFEHAGRDQYLLDQLWTLDPTHIIAGMSIVGMWQRRMESIIEFARKPIEDKNRQDMLHVRNVIALFRIGKSAQNNMTLSDVFKPYMERRQLQLIFEATPEEWDVASEQDRSFTDMCKVIRVEEPTEDTALRMLGRVRNRLEAAHDVRVEGPVLLNLMGLQRRFFSRDSMMGGAAARLQQLAVKHAGRTISEQVLLEAFEAQTHLNPLFAQRDQLIAPDTFAHYIDKRLIGQPEALGALVDLLHNLKAELNNAERPYGSFLFIGPTGVGKTEAAKVLADFLFTHEDRLLRFDMNEYIDAYAVSRLVGDASQPEGQLTNKVRFNPFCVLLFDEIEKADPEVHNLLLQVLGEGRLTDALGRTVSFSNTVIIMTSNLGAERIGREIQIQRREEPPVGAYEKAVRDFFRPEFVNRIDRLVVFHPLAPEHIARIAHLQIGALLRRHGFVRRHTFLDVSQEALEHIAARGFDPMMGGRALKRQIEKDMTVLIADQLAGIPPGNPVLFQIRLAGSTIVPHITRFEHVPARAEPLFPDFGGKKPDIKHFEQLLHQITAVKETLMGEEEGEYNLIENPGEDAEMNFELQMRDELYHLEDRLQQLFWDYQARKYVDFAQTNFQIKTLTRKAATQHRSEVHYLRDLYHQLDVVDYLAEASKAAENIVGEANALWVEIALELAFIRRQVAAYQERGIDYVAIRLSGPALSNAVQHYLSCVNQFHMPVHAFRMDRQYLLMAGPGLYDILKPEAGYHLAFYKSAPARWMRVEVFQISESLYRQEVLDKDYSRLPGHLPPLRQEEATAPVVRLFHVVKPGESRGTDLRTGITFDPHGLDKTLMRSILYASFPPAFHLQTGDDENA